MNWNQYSHYYLVGIKGVAMTSLAQILLDAGKTVQGSDTPEEFVTKDILSKLGLSAMPFESEVPAEVDCVVYTAAHKGQFNPQVVAAQERGIACFSQAEAIAAFFNEKKGVAVCGVGGKSTTSAMITWILEKTDRAPSFSVGVGKIIGLERTGQWRSESEYFVAEADEYVTDPTAPSRDEPITPRFSYMHPFVTVCTNFAFDHPDVYKTLEDTKQAYQTFFDQINPDGALLLNDRDRGVVPVSGSTQKVYYFGASEKSSEIKSAVGQDLPILADFGIKADSIQNEPGKTTATLFDRSDVLMTSQKQTTSNGEILSSVSETFQNPTPSQDFSALELVHSRNLPTTEQLHQIILQVPGTYNLENAAYAVFTCKLLGVAITESCAALASFQSTKRRFEKIGEKNGILYFDDYAHHPSEVKNVIKAISLWYPQKRVVIAFQSHTFSRTKQLFDQFVEAFQAAKEVVLLDIFASAREAYDPSITSDMLVAAVTAKYPNVEIQNLKTIENLASFLEAELRPGDICLTIGAGDIYKVHELIRS